MLLRSMEPDEYPAYRQIVVAEYAKDLAVSRRCSLDEALLRATALIDLALPQGPDSSATRLQCIMAEGGTDSVVGYLWISVNETTAWVYDIYLHPDARGKGYGKKALDAINRELAREGVVETGLRVAANNDRAKKLYESLGFEVTGFNMSKRL